MNSDIYIESEKMRGSSLFTTAVPYSSNPDKSNDFLTLLEKMQSQRLDEQRCEMPDVHVRCEVKWLESVQKFARQPHKLLPTIDQSWTALLIRLRRRRPPPPLPSITEGISEGLATVPKE
ncbi:hypothetical protein Q1695_012887 [Nippostrongylus brasiliensis]|nr:hypothetical protein Q1695_012887 [Nippostrongylus brasiliensis]